MSSTQTNLLSVAGTLIAPLGALLIGGGLAGIIITATLDLAAFGSFAPFVQLATPYAYAGSIVLLIAGFTYISLGVSLRRGRAYWAGLVASMLLATAGLAVFLFADRIPLEPLINVARGGGLLLLLPAGCLLLAYPGSAHR